MKNAFATSFLLLSATLVACSPTADQAPSSEATMAAAPAASVEGCFLRGATAEEAAARPSPLGRLAFTLGDADGFVCYGRPSANGREVMGALVPFGEPWRLGANEATSIHLSAPATIGDVAVEAGAYSIYAIPGETEWQFVVNGQVERWGIPINDEVTAANVGTVTRPVTATEAPVEQFTVSYVSHGDTMGHLVFEWENTRVELPLHTAGM